MWVEGYSFFWMVYSELPLYEEKQCFLAWKEEVNRIWKKESKECQRLPWEREKYAAIVVPATPSLFGLVTPRRFWAPNIATGPSVVTKHI